MTKKRKVVVTGMGMVSPLGCGVGFTWNNLIAGKSGIKNINQFDTSDLSIKIAATLPGRDENHGFNPDDYISTKDQKKMDPFIQYGIIASEEALKDSGWEAKSEREKMRTGVLIGSGIGGLQTIDKYSIITHERGPRYISPFFIPASLINLISGHLSINHGFMGPNSSVVTACTTSAHAIGDAAKLIMDNDADVMIAGGSEAAVCKLGIAGFAAMKALTSQFNDSPEQASRPWDQDRSGFVMGEGAGILVLEEYEHAKKRGAKIYGELAGYGLSGDASHMTSPHPEGLGAYNAMIMALAKAQVDPAEVNYVNAHATSTLVGDDLELRTVERCLGNRRSLMMSSTKSSIGHSLGATGAMEAIFTILSIKNSVVPATLNLYNTSYSSNIDLVALQPKEQEVNVAMSNNFGFGGTNASLVFKKVV